MTDPSARTDRNKEIVTRMSEAYTEFETELEKARAEQERIIVEFSEVLRERRLHDVRNALLDNLADDYET